MPESKNYKKPVVAMLADYPRDINAVDGGVQAVTAYLVKEIVSTGEVDLRLVTFDSSVETPVRLRANGFERYLLPRQRLGASTRWRYDFTRLRKCLSQINPSVVHAQGAGVDGYLAVKSGYPSVVTFHGIMTEDAKYKSHVVEKVRLMMHGWITERYCAKHAYRTILISPYVKEHYGTRLQGISHMIPNPVDEKFYGVRRREVAGRILFAGKVIPRKGVTDLIEAFSVARQHADLRLILAGSISDKVYVNHLKKRVTELGVGPHVEFLGLLKESDLLEEFARAAILILPSYQETAPMVIQQAMACALPVVATRICGIPNQISDGKTGLLFQPGDRNALANHIIRLIVHDADRDKMGRNARVKAMAEYRAERVAEQTVAVYRQLTG